MLISILELNNARHNWGHVLSSGTMQDSGSLDCVLNPAAANVFVSIGKVLKLSTKQCTYKTARRILQK